MTWGSSFWNWLLIPESGHLLVNPWVRYARAFLVIIVSEERAGFIFYFQFDDQRYFISMPSTCSNGIQGCRRRFGSVQDSGCMTTIARGMSQGTLIWFKSFFHIQNVVVFTLSYKLKTSRIKIFNLFLMLDWWSFSLIPSVSEYVLPRQFFKINLQFQPMYCNFWVHFSYLSNPCSCCWLHLDKGCNGYSSDYLDYLNCTVIKITIFDQSSFRSSWQSRSPTLDCGSCW